jgi:hypothetical protein
MVFIQKAIEARKLSGDLEAKANKVLDDRAKALVAAVKEAGPESPSVWDLPAYAGGAARRDGELYAAAAEVARATAGK